ncbi:MAG: aspartate kinase [Bacteroidales bacterium]|nr:aspartate kinase [Bacteroidales bacterium]
MFIYKFGGASLKDSEGIKTVGKIIKRNAKEGLVIVISAMGKTTNALEIVHKYYLSGDKNNCKAHIETIKMYHLNLIGEIFSEKNNICRKINNYFLEIEEITNKEPSLNPDFEYDKIVSYGELISSTIISEYLKSIDVENEWVDIREYLITDDFFREANINFALSEKLICGKFKSNKIFVTQGFIGGTITKLTTTLGREGSDYTAALLGYFLNAESVTIWKDVPGILTADPKIMNNYTQIKKLSYEEAIELAYYGAQVIHPRTIKPLQNKNIPLYVKPFYNEEETGTEISCCQNQNKLPPIFIHKFNQCIINITSKDFSFIVEENIKYIFTLLCKHKLKTNLLQQSAISISLCVDYDERKVYSFTKELENSFTIKIETNLTLLTIRHYTLKVLAEQVNSNNVILEDINRYVAKLVIKN